MSLALFVLLSILMLVPGSARAESDGTFNYTVNEKGQVTITGLADTSVKDVVIPGEIDGKPVVEIGEKAFWGEKIKSVSIPASVEAIVKMAFYECYDLTTISFATDGNLKSIGESAFRYSRIKNVSIPASVEAIGDYAFERCDYVSMISFATDGNLKSIGEYAFYGAPINSISIPSFVETIGDYAFGSCSSLTSVTFASDGNLKSIGVGAFQKAAVKNISIPASVETIGDKAFMNCVSISAVTFASDGNLKSIGEGTFQKAAVKNISIPASVEKIGHGAFGGCESLSTVTFASDGNLKFIAGFSETAIKNVSIPASVDTIGVNAFGMNWYLTSVTFASDGNLKCIGDSAFYITPIESISIPASVETIGDMAFAQCHLSTVTFAPDSKLKTIGKSAFYCIQRTLKNITIPASVETIGEDAFGLCYSLSEITFAPNSKLKTIDKYAFYMAGLVSISIPASVETIGNYAFSESSSLSTVIFPSDANLTTIDSRAFQGCTAIESISIPSSVETISNSAFSGCSSLSTLTFASDGNLKNIYNGAFARTAIGNISIPASVEQIMGAAFGGCSSLSTVTFASDGNLKFIDNGAFAETAIENISIPASVEMICQYAFGSCSSLSMVTFKRIPWEDSIGDYDYRMFSACNALATISVPSGSEEIYRIQLRLGEGVKIISQEFTVGDLKYKSNETLDGLICTGLAPGESQPTRIEIPSEVNGSPVTGIAADAFQDNATLEYIMVKDVATYDRLKSQEFAGSDKLVVHPDEALTLTDASGLTAITRPTLYDAGQLQYPRTFGMAGQYATLCLPFDLPLSQTQGIFDKVYVPMSTMIHNKAKSTALMEHFILMLMEQESDATIKAGQPIFVKLSGDALHIAFANQDEVVLSANAQPLSQEMTVVDWNGTSGLMTENKQFCITYKGTFLPQEASAADNFWTFNADGSFGWQKQGTIYAFRQVLNVEQKGEAAQAKQHVITIGVGDGTTTGIREILASGASPSDASSSEGNGSADASSAASHAAGVYDLSGRKVGENANDVKKLRKGVYVHNGKKMVVK